MYCAFESLHNDDIGPAVGRFTANGSLVDGIPIVSAEASESSNHAIRYELVSIVSRVIDDMKKRIDISNAYANGPKALAAAIGYLITDESTIEGKRNMDTCRELIASKNKKEGKE